jgi:hypothetical protein
LSKCYHVIFLLHKLSQRLRRTLLLPILWIIRKRIPSCDTGLETKKILTQNTLLFFLQTPICRGDCDETC